MKFFSAVRRVFAGIIGWSLSIWRHVPPSRALLLTSMVAGSLVYAVLSMQYKDATMRRELVTQTKLLASAIPDNLISALSGTSEDLERPEYHRLKNILHMLRQQAPHCYFLYLAGQRPDGTIFFYIKNLSPDSPDYSPPGISYGEADQEYAAAVRRGDTLINGPIKDRWGTWFAAQTPIVNAKTGEPICTFGADIAAANWYAKIIHHIIPGLVTILMLVVIIALSPRVCERIRSRHTPLCKYPGPWPTVLAGGLIITAFLSWRSYQTENYQRLQGFIQLAICESDLVMHKLQSTGSRELRGLANFFTASNAVTEESFNLFASQLRQKCLYRLWGWGKAVADVDRERFEQEQRLLRGKDFSIMEPDEYGLPGPARVREVYYPLILARPCELGQYSIIGYDLGHEPHRLAALQEAIRTGLPTSTRPILHGYLTEGVKGVDLFYPVMDRGQPQAVSGFVMAAMSLDELIAPNLHASHHVHFSFWTANDGSEAELLVGEKSPKPHHKGAFSRPISYFGQMFRMTAHPTAAFFQAYPIVMPWLLAVSGVALSITFAVIVSVLNRQHCELQMTAQNNAYRLSQTEERFNLLLEQTKTMLWECNPEGIIINAQPPNAKIYGRNREDVFGKMHYREFHPIKGREDYVNKIRSMFGYQDKFFNFVYPIEQADGSQVTVSTSGFPIYDDKGVKLGYYGWCLDVSEQVLLNEQLQKSQAKAEAANRAKSDFLANMSHEVRTPINGIIGFIDLLQDTPLNREQREYLDLVGGSSRQLLALVNEILDFTRLEAGQATIVPEDFNLEKLLEDAASNIAVAAAAKQLEVIVVIPPDLPTALHGDAFHLQQIILNLTTNAIKFTERGEIVISVTSEHEDDSRITLRFAVRDTGIGLTEQQQKHIFDVFYQVDPSLKRKQSGVGLGLSIVKNLLERMDSEIQVVSTLGQGSEFSFALTLDKQPGAQSIPELTASLAPILVIDDNSTVRSDLLTRLNYQRLDARGAGSMTAARQRLSEMQAAGTPPQLIILDLDLPELQTQASDLHWLELLQANIPILGLAPMANRGALPLKLTAKVTHTVIKPVRNRDLFNAIMAIKNATATPEALAAQLSEPQSADNSRPDNSRAAQNSGPAQILLAEDNVVNQKVVLAILNKLGYAVDIVSNGFEALERLRRHPYQLVLMDVQMPGMDGLEATRLLRHPSSDVLNPAIPVIALTAHAVEGYREICRQAGMNDYVTKPITMKQIRRILDNWLPKETP
ncbi:MAG TPA: response regulator [Lentisphaeria bacterium]|nr:response regulator [Lentisphaeria bacterium]